jgi:hypothetical protein
VRSSDFDPLERTMFTKKLIFLVVALAAFALPSLASAATVSLDSESDTPSYRYVAADGEANNLTVTTSSSSTTLRDTAGLQAGDGCTQVDPQTATCPTRYGGARLEDGDDRAQVKGPYGAALFGGAGNDVLTGGDGADFLQGDYGDDTITGGRGGDQIHAKDGNDRVNAADKGPDEVLCSRGIDRVKLDRVDRYKACEKRKVAGRMYSTLSIEVGNDELDAVQLDDGSMESFFNVSCRNATARCAAGAQIVAGGRVIASSAGSDPQGFVSLDFTYPRSAIGSDAREIPVEIKLTVKQKGRTEHRSIPKILAVEQPRSDG